jgi:hypothetical protein
MTLATIALLLAQSCVGEAGFKSAETGECAAIAHVYLKRSEKSGLSFVRVMRRYSAAIKPGVGKLWVRNLRHDGLKPRGWPRHLKWSRYVDDWRAVLNVANAFLAGRVKDPLPNALHYGGWIDRHRLGPAWQRIPVDKFRNWFYRRRK